MQLSFIDPVRGMMDLNASIMAGTGISMQRGEEMKDFTYSSFSYYNYTIRSFITLTNSNRKAARVGSYIDKAGPK